MIYTRSNEFSLRQGLHIRLTARCVTFMLLWISGKSAKELISHRVRIYFRLFPSIRMFVLKDSTNIVNSYLGETRNKIITYEEYLDYMKPHRDQIEFGKGAV